VPCCPNFAAKRLALGPDGNVWFTTLHYLVGYSPANWIGTINATGSQSYFRVLYGAIHYPAYPSGITTADGNLWFTGDDPFQLNGGLWRLDTSGAMHAYPIAYNPVTIATGRHHHLWFTSHFGGQPSQIVEVTLP
jgi:streptogramin lyase